MYFFQPDPSQQVSKEDREKFEKEYEEYRQKLEQAKQE
jgi:hypothetical protein